MKAKDLTLKVVNEVEKGKFEIRKFKPYMTYQGLIGCILADAEILRPTGLKDKTGKEIYEGDLLEFELEDELDGLENFINVVIWEKGCFALRAEKEYDYVDYPLFEWTNGRIIGNIYENPELLNSQK